MKAVQIKNYGHSDVFEVSDVETLKRDDDHILVEIHLASINPFDVKIASGAYKEMIPMKLPYTPGGDFSGVINDVNKDNVNFKVGDEVFGGVNVLSGGSGSFAEFALGNSENIYLKPKKVSFEESAASVLVGVSAVQAIEEHIKLKPGQKILIHGGAGGIGHMAIQIAKKIGAFVATTVSNDDIEFVRKFGADQIIDYKSENFEKILTEFDAVYDTVGGETTKKSFDVLKEGGVLVSMLGEPDQNIAKQLGITAIGQSTKITTERLKNLAKYLENGDVKVNIDKIFPIEEIKNAVSYFENSSPKGKIVIKVK